MDERCEAQEAEALIHTSVFTESPFITFVVLLYAVRDKWLYFNRNLPIFVEYFIILSMKCYKTKSFIITTPL